MSDERGSILLAIARESLVEALGIGRGGQGGEYGHLWLLEPGATFVTLMRSGRLRGCVGSLRAYRPLFDDVRSNARAAAFSDTRFPPLHRDEFPEIAVEVSLLSTPEEVRVSCEEEACAVLRPGVDGVIFECEECRSTFLPQVWEQLPDPRDFLGQLKRKAGLPPSYWRPEVRLWRYTVVKWAEREKVPRP